MTTAHAIRIEQPGAPEAMRLEAIDLPPPAAGEAQLRQTAVGFNYIDVYQRSGLYALPLPSGIGHEAAGVVEAVGEGVDGVRVGDRVVDHERRHRRLCRPAQRRRRQAGADPARA